MSAYINTSNSCQLIRVFQGQIGGALVNVCDARKLHSFLQNRDMFANWIRARIEKYGFEDNKDFQSFLVKTKKPRGGRPTIEYYLSIDMAKELSMVENNDQGRKVRRYFIECEKRLTEIAPHDVEKISANTIGVDGFRCLGAVIDGKVQMLPAEQRRRVKQHIWAQIHKTFNVASGKDIPATRMAEACNFVAAYALQGEWIKASAPVPMQNFPLTWHELNALYGTVKCLRSMFAKQNDLYQVAVTLDSGLLNSLWTDLHETRARLQPLTRSWGQIVEALNQNGYCGCR